MKKDFTQNKKNCTQKVPGKKIPRPGDFLIFVITLGAAIFFTLKSANLTFGEKSQKMTVEADGKKYEYSLKNDGIYNFEGKIGITTVEVKNGKAKIIDSACPNKTCVNQGYSNTIVCLPNKVIVKIQNNSENGAEDFDAISK